MGNIDKKKKKYFNDKNMKANGTKTQQVAEQTKTKNEAPKKNQKKNQNQKQNKKTGVSSLQKAKTFAKKIFSFQTVSNLIFNPSYLWIAACVLIAAESVLNVFIIENIKYTEIDWIAYMQEVGGFLNGTWDYTKLKGDTGPLVYPAGFVYIYSGLYYLTEKGTNLRTAQYIFAAIYIVTLSLVFRIYHKTKKVPPYMLLFMCCTSYRIHSIFVLRLFNDPIAMMFLYLAINFFISNKWTLGSIFYSFAVSIKMNVLLFAPALLFVYLYTQGFLGTVKNLFLCAAVQVAVGAPFLSVNPYGYFKQAFDLGRVFLYEWTVNWRFLEEDVFLDKRFHLGLLGAHGLILLIFTLLHWRKYLSSFNTLKKGNLTNACQLLVLPLFTSNFIGIVFSRSLHYQFYVWYFHTLPYLVWSTQLSVILRLLLLGLLELCWNQFPSTIWSSALMLACHTLILLALLQNMPRDKKQPTSKKKYK